MMTDTPAAATPPAATDLDGAAIEAALAAQGIRLAPGRADRLVAPLAASIGPAMADPLRMALCFDQDPVGHALAVARCVAGDR